MKDNTLHELCDRLITINEEIDKLIREQEKLEAMESSWRNRNAERGTISRPEEYDDSSDAASEFRELTRTGWS